MTDEEILKRLAEIEDVQNSTLFDEVRVYHRTLNVCDMWNPITEWSDLGPLIEKYRPEIIPMKLGGWQIDLGYGSEAVWDESLPHAICLAIIESQR